MPRFPRPALPTTIAIISTLAVPIVNAQIVNPKQLDSTIAKAFTARSAAPATASVPVVPLTFPLFAEDGDFATTPVLVNGSAVSTFADIALRSPDGRTIATQRVQFLPHSQVPVNLRALLDSGSAPNTP